MSRRYYSSRRRRRRVMMIWIAAVTVVVLAGAVAVVLIIGKGAPDTVRGRADTKTFSTDFAGQAGSVTSLRSPTGTRYQLQLDRGNTGLEVRDHTLVRGNTANFGPQGAPILITQLPRRPLRVSVKYSFTPGETASQTIILGTCAEAFGLSSIQLKVSPTYWTVIYTHRRAGKGNGVEIARIAQHLFRPALPVDSAKTYQASMAVDLKTSTVTVGLPDGTTEKVTSPTIAKYWGARLGVQIGHLQATDGDVKVRGFSATVPKTGR